MTGKVSRNVLNFIKKICIYPHFLTKFGEHIELQKRIQGGLYPQLLVRPSLHSHNPYTYIDISSSGGGRMPLKCFWRPRVNNVNSTFKRCPLDTSLTQDVYLLSTCSENLVMTHPSRQDISLYKTHYFIPHYSASEHIVKLQREKLSKKQSVGATYVLETIKCSKNSGSVEDKTTKQQERGKLLCYKKTSRIQKGGQLAHCNKINHAKEES